MGSGLKKPPRVGSGPDCPPPVPARTVPVPGFEPGTRVGRVRVDKGRVTQKKKNPSNPYPCYPRTRTRPYPPTRLPGPVPARTVPCYPDPPTRAPII